MIAYKSLEKFSNHFPFLLLTLGGLFFSFGSELFSDPRYLKVLSSILILTSLFYFIFICNCRLRNKRFDFFVLVMVCVISYFESSNTMFSSLNNFTFIAALFLLNEFDEKKIKFCLITSGIIFFIVLTWFIWSNPLVFFSNGENRFATLLGLQVFSLRLIFSGIGEAGVILSIWFFGCYFYLNQKKIRYSLMALLLILMLSTGSRSALLGFLLGLFLIWFDSRRWITLVLIIFLSALLAGSILKGSGMSSVNHRIEIVQELHIFSLIDIKTIISDALALNKNLKTDTFPVLHNWILDFFIYSPIAATIYVLLIIKFLILIANLYWAGKVGFEHVVTSTILFTSLFDATLVPNKPSYINLILVAVIFSTLYKYPKVLLWKKFL